MTQPEIVNLPKNNIESISYSGVQAAWAELIARSAIFPVTYLPGDGVRALQLTDTYHTGYAAYMHDPSTNQLELAVVQKKYQNAQTQAPLVEVTIESKKGVTGAINDTLIFYRETCPDMSPTEAFSRGLIPENTPEYAVLNQRLSSLA